MNNETKTMYPVFSIVLVLALWQELLFSRLHPKIINILFFFSKKQKDLYNFFINLRFDVFSKRKKSFIHILKPSINFCKKNKIFDEFLTIFPFALVSINLIPYSIASWKYFPQLSFFFLLGKFHSHVHPFLG
jgi:hypothetical protein